MNIHRRLCRWHGLGWDALLLLARVCLGATFWMPGQTKVEGWQLTASALYLFQEEYRLPLLDPAVAAGAAAIAEHLLPLLLLLGLGTRFAAAGLLAMTLVIQLWVYPSAWPTHGTWAVALLLLIGQGGGRLTLDHLVRRYWQQSRGDSANECTSHADPELCMRAPQ